MTTRNCCNCVFAAPLEVDGKNVLICANRPGSAGFCVCVGPEEVCPRFWRQGQYPSRTRRAKPPEPASNDLRHIGLTRGRFAIVAAADFDALSQYNWYWCPAKSGFGYARRSGAGKVSMHRQIMAAPKGMVVDHIDGNGLNNRRSNLRLCTPQENQRNRRASRARQEQGLFKGVYHRPGNPRAYALIGYEGKTHHIGVFDTDIEAAKAYDAKAVELFGEFACLNFPEDHGRAG